MDKMHKSSAHADTKHKIRIYGQAWVLNRLDVPQTTMQKDPTTGILVPVTEKYMELPCTQFAVNYNGLGISPEEFVIQWEELGKAVWNSMQEKGVTR